MPPSSFTEGLHAEAFVVSQPPSQYCKDAVTILAGSGSARVLTAGMVLGKRMTATATSAAGAGNVGNGVMGTVTPTTQAKPGTYSVVIVEPGANVGSFILIDPFGKVVGHGNVASAFVGELGFTLADGGTDFVAGDFFAIEVVPSAFKWLQFAQAGTAGEQVAAGVLRDDVTAPDGTDAKGVAFVRGPCEVNALEITWPAGITGAEKALAIRQLERVGIIVR